MTPCSALNYLTRHPKITRSWSISDAFELFMDDNDEDDNVSHFHLFLVLIEETIDDDLLEEFGNAY